MRANWRDATFVSAPELYAWRRWEYHWDAREPGAYVLQSRAHDAMGHVQPAVAEWNQFGYANNAIESVAVQIIR